jgi:hypothetical protein
LDSQSRSCSNATACISAALNITRETVLAFVRRAQLEGMEFERACILYLARMGRHKIILAHAVKLVHSPKYGNKHPALPTFRGIANI